jgi:hypothetical protein
MQPLATFEKEEPDEEEEDYAAAMYRRLGLGHGGGY